MTQTVFGKATVLARSEGWGYWLPAPGPDGPASDPSPAARPAAPPSRAPLLSGGPAAVCKHFLPPPPPPPPLAASQLERVGLAAGSGLALAPTLLPRPPGLGSGPPSGYVAAIWETQAPGAVGGRLGSPGLRRGGGQLARRAWPRSLPVVTCSLAGVSRGGRPLPALSPHAVAHAGSSAGPHAREAAGSSAAQSSCPGPRRPGSTAPASQHRALPDLPPGARSARAPASPQTLRARGEGGGRFLSTVPGGRARGARDGARPETSSAGGAERGGGHRRSYSLRARGSQLGPAPQRLSLTCLTPPQPGPAPRRPLAVPAPPPPPAPGAHVTGGTAPSDRA